MAPSALCFVHVEHRGHRAGKLIHRLNALAFLRHINCTEVPDLISFDPRVLGRLINVDFSKAESSAGLARCHDPAIVNSDFVNTIILISAIESSEDSLAELVEARDASGLCIPDESINFLVDYNVVITQVTHKLVLVHLAAHIRLNMPGHLTLVLISCRLRDKLPILLGAPMVVKIENGHRGSCRLFACVKCANRLLNLGELGCLRVLHQVVLQLVSSTEVLLNHVQKLRLINLSVAVVLVHLEESLVLVEWLQIRERLRGNRVATYLILVLEFILH